MNSFFIASQYLATGQSLPYTGSWTNVAQGRNAFVAVYVSGASVPVTGYLQTQTLFNNDVSFTSGQKNEGINIYTVNITGNNTYATPAFFNTPFATLRLVVPNGSGKIWSSVTVQN